MLLIAEDDTLIVNSTLPVIEFLSSRAIYSQASYSIGDGYDKIKAPSVPEKGNSRVMSVGNGFAWLIIALAMSIPVPFAVGAVGAVSRLTMHSVSGIKFEATTNVMENDLVEWDEVDPDNMEN